MAKKPTVTTITTGYSSADTLNENFEALRDGFDNTLSLDGSTPNAMGADLDLNGNNIIGAAGLLVNGTNYLADVEAAKAAALVAQAAAELAETNAETAETNAGVSETAAASSATAAATSETNAGASETASSGSATASATSATNSATSASEAAASASAASTSETNASTSETNAATSETNAATSATESETAKTAAEAAKDAALAALDSFDDRYLGAKASDPTLDNDGNALVAGALYYNTTSDVMKVYEGSVWVAAYASLAGALLTTNNLSDLASATTARTNLGLGTTNSPTFGGLDVIGGTNTTIRAVIGGGDQALLVVNGDRDNDGDAGPEDSAILLATDGVYSSSVNSGFGNYGYRIGTINSGGVTGLKFTEAKAGVDIERMRIDTNGNVGISKTNPATALDVAGTVTATAYAGDGSALTGVVRPNDSPTFTGLTTTSDVLFGDNIAALFGATNDLQISADSFATRIRATPPLDISSSAIITLGGSSAPAPAMIVDPAVGTLFLDSLGSPVAIIPNSGLAIQSNVDLDVTGTVTATSYAGDGSNLTGIAAGAAGGGSDEIFYENGQNVTTNYTITNGKNAMSAGPITIDSGVTVTVGAGETWTVV